MKVVHVKASRWRLRYSLRRRRRLQTISCERSCAGWPRAPAMPESCWS